MSGIILGACTESSNGRAGKPLGPPATRFIDLWRGRTGAGAGFRFIVVLLVTKYVLIETIITKRTIRHTEQNITIKFNKFRNTKLNQLRTKITTIHAELKNQ